MIKSCSKCFAEKDISKFYPRPTKRDPNRRHTQCVACLTTYKQDHYRRNKTRYNQLSRDWKSNNPQRAREIHKQWRRDNPNYDKEWAARNPDRYRARRRRHFEKNREMYLDRWGAHSKMKYYTIEGRAKGLWRLAHKRALVRRIPFTIPVEWVLNKLSAGVCERTGLQFSFEKRSPFAPSIDRVVAEEGYTPENARVVVFAYNAAKGTGRDEDVLTIARALLGIPT